MEKIISKIKEFSLWFLALPLSLLQEYQLRRVLRKKQMEGKIISILEEARENKSEPQQWVRFSKIVSLIKAEKKNFTSIFHPQILSSICENILLGLVEKGLVQEANFFAVGRYKSFSYRLIK